MRDLNSPPKMPELFLSHLAIATFELIPIIHSLNNTFRFQSDLVNEKLHIFRYSVVVVVDNLPLEKKNCKTEEAGRQSKDTGCFKYSITLFRSIITEAKAR